MGALGFKIWIFAPKSYLFGGIRVRNQLISAVCLQFALKSLFFNDFFATIPSLKLQMSADCLQFQLFVYFLSAVLFTFSAICLQFQLIVYNFSCLFTFCQLFCLHFQLFVYNFSCLFTFLSADCLLLNFRAKILVFSWLFCHYRCFNTLIVNYFWTNFTCQDFPIS